MIIKKNFRITHQIIFMSFLCFLSYSSLFAQNKLPVLRSNTASVDIKEGELLYQKIWNASPEVKLDVFITNPFVGTKRIVFYSDIDSISFTVKPNQKYNFIILLKGKKAYTQINTYPNEKPSLEPKLSYSRINSSPSLTDVIPFTLGNDDRIHLKGKINDSDILDFLFDTGAGICVITSSLINHKVNLTIDGNEENSGSDGKSTVGRSNKNAIEINNLVWKNAPFVSIDYKDRLFDAVLSGAVFENKVIEIDYEKNILVIHQSLPQLSAEYTKLKYKLIGGIPYIMAKLIVNGKESEGWFDFDTGSDGPLIIGQKFAKDNSLNNSMKQLGTRTSSGSAGNKIKNDVVILPKLKLGNYEMYQIPLLIQQQEVAGVENNENIGNNILKRFNTIIDFRNQFIYLKPNNLFYSPIWTRKLST